MYKKTLTMKRKAKNTAKNRREDKNMRNGFSNSLPSETKEECRNIKKKALLYSQVSRQNIH